MPWLVRAKQPQLGKSLKTSLYLCVLTSTSLPFFQHHLPSPRRILMVSFSLPASTSLIVFYEMENSTDIRAANVIEKSGGWAGDLTQITITRSSWSCKLNSPPLSCCKSREPREQPYVQHQHTSEQVSLFEGSWDGNLTFQSTEEERFVSCQWADDMSSWQWFKMHQTVPETFSQLFICLDNFQLFCPTSLLVHFLLATSWVERKVKRFKVKKI